MRLDFVYKCSRVWFDLEECICVVVGRWYVGYVWLIGLWWVGVGRVNLLILDYLGELCF